jgi:hypothetical protein
MSWVALESSAHTALAGYVCFRNRHIKQSTQFHDRIFQPIHRSPRRTGDLGAVACISPAAKVTSSLSIIVYLVVYTSVSLVMRRMAR